MYVTAFFTDHGLPKTGLHPICDIWILHTNVHLIVGAAMSEIGGGFYKYHFNQYDQEIDYVVRCDGGAALDDMERYKEGLNQVNLGDIADETWDETADPEHIHPNTMGEVLQSRASQVSVNNVSTAVGLLIQLGTGHWKIQNYKMTFYDALNNPIVTFKLFDKNGNPTDLTVFERVPI